MPKSPAELLRSLDSAMTPGPWRGSMLSLQILAGNEAGSVTTLRNALGALADYVEALEVDREGFDAYWQATYGDRVSLAIKRLVRQTWNYAGKKDWSFKAYADAVLKNASHRETKEAGHRKIWDAARSTSESVDTARAALVAALEGE